MILRLYKLTGGQALRTPYVEGSVISWPWPGKPLVMIGKPLDPSMDGRWFNTSAITDASLFPGGGSIIFTTRSGSRYLLTAPGAAD